MTKEKKKRTFCTLFPNGWLYSFSLRRKIPETSTHRSSENRFKLEFVHKYDMIWKNQDISGEKVPNNISKCLANRLPEIWAATISFGYLSREKILQYLSSSNLLTYSFDRNLRKI